ncbi:acyltransferase family protein [Bacillus megaterium]|uniref:acyltransferase family protein n=1 Tax=Priestia megaterium TaxID=1404 RepID=UPI0012932F53|nr:acyltransferase [Priestia megaterium]MQR87066.1 acyltransferase family protein [Priestia megaterium]
MEKKRLEWLDAIRGIGAIMVMIIHLWEKHSEYSANQSSITYIILNFLIRGIYDFGKIGVVLFFAVSGFVIPYSLLRHGSNNVLRFIVSRFFRLYPLYWISIGLAVTFVSHEISMKQLIANITMFQGFLFVDNILGAYWTLQIELAFYILCTFLFIFKLLQKDYMIILNIYGWTTFALALAITRYITGLEMPVALPLGLAVMFFGLAFRKYMFQEGNIHTRKIYATLVFFLIMTIPISIFAYSQYWYKYVITYSIALTFFILFSNFRNKKFIFLSFLGKISYSVYLLHPIFALAVYEHLSNTYFGKYVGSFILMLLSIICALISSTIFYYLIEKPSVNLGKILTRKISYHINLKSKPRINKAKSM